MPKAAILTTLAVALIIGLGTYFVLREPPAEEIQQTNESPAASDPSDPAPEQPSSGSYTGTVLAGTSAPLLDFTAEDYEVALASDKLIVLYFYANWCPICRAEFPKMQAAFNELTTDQVIGFRVNFNDNQTDAAEQNLARQHGVAYQHTKVFVQNGQQTLKSPETWEQNRYLTEINTALAP